MKIQHALLMTFLLWTLTATTQVISRKATHGTINILLANSNGMVLVTDSRRSTNYGQHFDDSPKLFQLDNKTVCSIAGFATDPGPFPEFQTEIAGVIRDFREDPTTTSLSFRDKFGTLLDAIRFQLEELREAYQSGQKTVGSSPFEFQLLMAGNDTDEKPKIAKAVIRIDDEVLPNYLSVKTTVDGPHKPGFGLSE